MPQDLINSLILFFPELLIVITVVLAIIFDLIPRTRWYVKYLSLLGLSLSITYVINSFALSLQYDLASIAIFQNMLKVGAFSDFFKIIILFTTIAVLIISRYNSEIDKEYQSEYYVLILSMCLGMMLLSSSTNFIMIYLSMELIGIPSYILAGMNKKDSLSNEASLKYIIYGSFASGVMLFGFSWLYGLTGTANLESLNIIGEAMSSPAMYVSFIFVLVGIGYKISMVPFHYWTPDVYEGSPTPITAFFSVAPKVAGIALIIRFIHSAFSFDIELSNSFNWSMIIALLSAVTMTVGNFLAIKQKNIKRMLAYSSISHIGFIMMSLCVMDDLASILLYIFIYTFMNLGAFFIVVFAEEKYGFKEFSDWDGFGYKNSILAAMMALNMVALTGLPPTSGFIAKFYIFSDLISSKSFYWLAIIGAINAVVSLYYYFKLLKHMYLNEPNNDIEMKSGFDLNFIVVVLSIQTLVFYFYWNPLVELIKKIGL